MLPVEVFFSLVLFEDLDEELFVPWVLFLLLPEPDEVVFLVPDAIRFYKFPLKQR